MAFYYGEDLSCVDDLDSELGVVSGPMAIAQSVARELITTAGSLFYDEEYGYNVRQHLNAPLVAAAEIAFNVEACAMRDERVEDARARVALVGSALRIGLLLETAFGPFQLVLSVDQLNIGLLITEIT